MRNLTIGLFILAQISLSLTALGQRPKVGLVLSGGGADGLAHIGILKALDEHNIPVDYITGTSIGGLIGALYASGYSPEEMEYIFTSNEYYRMSKGEIEERFRYYFNSEDPHASLLTIRFSGDSIFRPILPTNLIDPAAIDLELVKHLAAPAAAADYNFDSLMIPFRCVASDIYEKRQLVFKSGYLPSAVRASMSYPFFIKPIKVNGKLLFDGGLYNNFPADIMCDDFEPDIVIGCNVAGKNIAPDEDDLLGQIRTLMMNQSNFDIPCGEGIIIEPEIYVGSFQFDKAQKIIDGGYREALKKIPELSEKTTPYDSSEYLINKRVNYRRSFPELKTEKINISGLNKNQQHYASKVMNRGLKKREYIDFKKLKNNYFRLYGDAGINSVYPVLTKSDTGEYFEMDLKVKKEHDLIIDFGGNFTSRPASHAYLGATHHYLSKIAVRTHANTYFGRLYAGMTAKSRISFASELPFYVEPHFTTHRFNYFRSRTASLLLEERPSYVLLRETFGGLDVGIPAGNRGKITFGGSYFHFEDDYYQIRSFEATDTSDVSLQEGMQFKVKYDQNNLNDNMWPTEGKKLSATVRYSDNRERQYPGSTAIFEEEQSRIHQWVLAQLNFENYFFTKHRLRVGWSVDAAYSTQDLLSNYTATIVRAPSFQPTPESRVLFLESFRAYQFAASGLKVIFQMSDNFHFRAEGYVFQPLREINKEPDTQEAVYGEYLDRRYTILSSSFVYSSPIGPLGLSVNYYHDNPDISLERLTPVTVMFNFGYILFNRRANQY